LPFDFTLTFGPEKRPGERTLDELSTAELDELSRQAAGSVEAIVLADGMPDLVLVNHVNLMARTAWHLKKRLGLPYRIISHGTDTQLLLRDARYRDLFAEPAREAECIFAISQYVAKEIAATVPARSIKVIGGAVDPQLFYPPAETPAAADAITFIGRLVTEKGLWTLLDAHARMAHPVALNVLGEGPLLDAIQAHLRNTTRRGRVNLLGFKPQSCVREVLINSALMVMPSVWQEPLGLVVMEAMACGVPVVASAVGGVPELIRHGVDGYLVPAGDPDALAGAIDQVLSDGALRARLRDALSKKTLPNYRDVARIIIQ
jgi:glycosyltransferase involved in cell wall biosynthesis